VRLQKILSLAGVASRRASEQLMREGRITVNGQVVRVLGSKADPGRDDIRVDGRRIRTDVQHRYLLVHKPKGYVTTRHDPEGRPTVMDLVGERGYLFPVGRLDYDSEGLLIVTSDGDLAARLTHPRHEVEKEYEVIVRGGPNAAALDRLRRGVFLEGRRTAPARVRVDTVVARPHPTTRLVIALHEGRNRQVRRMCRAVGLTVRSLRRTRIGPITLGRLKPGSYRRLDPREVGVLRRAAGMTDSH
jgi:pseudouridine synthase